MVSPTENYASWFGLLRLVRPLDPHPAAERWLAVHDRDASSHAVYRFPARPDRWGQRKFLSAASQVAAVADDHVLPIEQFAIDSQARGCVVTPYTGNQSGLLTLQGLADSRGGSMRPSEVHRAAVHLLGGLRVLHNAGLTNGAFTPGQILVDRSGRLLFDLYGFVHALHGRAEDQEGVRRDEVRSVVRIAYLLTTGVPTSGVAAPARLILPDVPREWDEWLEEGLEPSGGFASAAEALDRLPPLTGAPGGRVRSAIRQLTRAIGVR